MHYSYRLPLLLALSVVIPGGPHYPVLYTLHTNFLRKGASLRVVVTGGALPIESDERLQLTAGKQTRIIDGLENLNGHVKIGSKSTALQFVRLRTSLATCLPWSDHREVEIIEHIHVSDLPNYGLKTDDYSIEDSGFMGILSSDAFKEGGFQPASVELQGDRYVITRWLLVEVAARTFNVQLVRETVTTSGAYECQVQINRPAPNLHGTTWWMMRYL